MSFETPDEIEKSSEATEQPMPPRRKIRWFVLACLLFAIFSVIEVVGSWAISAKLRATVASKLDAELKIGTLIYCPPYGAWVWDVELRRPKLADPLFKLPSGKISLAELPWGRKPIVIASLSMQKPEVNIAPGGFAQLSRREPDKNAPRKLSDILRLESLRLKDARLTYRDGKHTGSPTVWDRLQLEIETNQQSVSGYTFHLVSRATALADASAAGAIDVDTGVLEVHNLTTKVRAEPEPIRTPFPQGVQQFIKDYRISGGVSISGNGTLPLRDIDKAAYTAEVSLDDGMGRIPQANFMLDHARADLFCEKKSDTPLHVRFEKMDVAGGGKELLIDGGDAEVDTMRGTWKLADVTGHVTVIRPTTLPSQSPIESVAMDKLTRFDRFEIGGRGDFSLAASGPFDLKGRDPWEAITHEVVFYPRGVSFRPKNFEGRIDDIGGGEVRLKGGMIIFQELFGKYDDDDLRLHAARLPIKGLPKLAQWQEISGVATFRQPLKPYTAKLDKILNALNPNGPFIIAGSWTVDRTGPTTRNSYDLIVSSDIGTLQPTKLRIPLNRVRGDATVTPAGVQLHGLEGQLFGGRFTATGQWVRQNQGVNNSFDGDLTLRDVDIAKVHEWHMPDTGKLHKGKVFGQATVSGAFTKGAPTEQILRGINARGEVEVVDGSLYRVPMLNDIFSLVGMKQAATIGDAAALFDMADGKIQITDAAVNAPAVGLQGGGKISLVDHGALDLTVVAAPLADWREKLKATNVPVVNSVGSELAGAIQKLLNSATGKLLYQFRVTGTTKDPTITPEPAPVLTETAAFVFGKMLAPSKKDQRPLDWFNREQQRAESR